MWCVMIELCSSDARLCVSFFLSGSFIETIPMDFIHYPTLDRQCVCCGERYLHAHGTRLPRRIELSKRFSREIFILILNFQAVDDMLQVPECGEGNLSFNKIV